MATLRTKRHAGARILPLYAVGGTRRFAAPAISHRQDRHRIDCVCCGMAHLLKGGAMSIRLVVKGIPGMAAVYRFVRGCCLRNKSPEDVFTDIFQKNLWKGNESVSGPGSSLDSAAALIEALPIMWRDLGIRTVLDIPCGDFHWMSCVDMSGIDYLGADIVADLIKQNARHERHNIRFRKINLLSDALPKVDFVLCRDLFGHLCFKDIFAALSNICASGSTYLLVSTSNTAHNFDIVTGLGRGGSVNLEVAPFFFPRPITTIDEKYRGARGAYRTVMGLWKVIDIARCC